MDYYDYRKCKNGCGLIPVPRKPNLDSLERGLSEKGDETLSEIAERLAEHGVDVPKFLKRVEELIRESK